MMIVRRNRLSRLLSSASDRFFAEAAVEPAATLSA